MKKACILLAVAALMAAACGQKPLPKEKFDTISTYHNEPGDTSLYGLACDGTTDSLLVFLPYTGGDPDTFDIFDALADHRVLGRPLIGDKLAVVLRTDTDSVASSIYPVAELVVNINRLYGQWNYMVTPTLKTLRQPARPLPDSIRQRFLAPREYGLRLKSDGLAYTTGMPRQQTSDERSPVVYPPAKRYNGWKLYNGHLILTTDSASHQQPDTATIVLMRRDSLVLRFADHEQAYYRANH